MALQTKIIEGKAFNYVLHVFTRSWLGQIRAGGLVMQREDSRMRAFELFFQAEMPKFNEPNMKIESVKYELIDRIHR